MNPSSVDLVIIAVLLVQAVIYTVVIGRFLFHKSPQSRREALPPVSIVICARNSAGRLQQHLPGFLTQDYPEFEVILVDDASEDRTQEVLREFSAIYRSLKIVTVAEKKSPGKKHALSLGIAAASYEQLALTDSDCSVMHNRWLRQLMQEAVAPVYTGYGAYRRTKGFLNMLIRFDTAFAALQYFGMALHGSPYMAVGRNMGYRREVFDAAGGFKAHRHIASGDDDLFIAHANAPVSIVCHPGTFTYSDPSPSWKAWFLQKARHLGTASSYKWYHAAFTGTVAMLNIAFYILTFLSLWNGSSTAWLLIVVKLIINYLFLGAGFQKLAERDLIWCIPLLDFIYILVQPIAWMISVLKRKNRWN